MADVTGDRTCVAAAREVLRTHDELARITAAGDRLERAGALRRWQLAMELLVLALGPEFPGRSPAAFRPHCERVVVAAEALGELGARKHLTGTPRPSATGRRCCGGCSASAA